MKHILVLDTYVLENKIDIGHLESYPTFNYSHTNSLADYQWRSFATDSDHYLKFIRINSIYPEATQEVAEYMKLKTGLKIDKNELRLMSFWGNIRPHEDNRFNTNTRLFLSFEGSNSNACVLITSDKKTVDEYSRAETQSTIASDNQLFFMRTDTIHETIHTDLNKKIYWFNYNLSSTIEQLEWGIAQYKKNHQL